MNDKDLILRLEALEKLVASHAERIAELMSKQARTELPTQDQPEKHNAEELVAKSLEERIVESLKKHGETATVDSERVKLRADQIRAELDKKAEEARARIRARMGV
jgi:hypothetical protein